MLWCDECGEVFAWTFSLRAHIAVTHTSHQPYQCVLCGLKFTLPSSLQVRNLAFTTSSGFRVLEFSPLSHYPSIKYPFLPPSPPSLGAHAVPAQCQREELQLCCVQEILPTKLPTPPSHTHPHRYFYKLSTSKIGRTLPVSLYV